MKLLAFCNNERGVIHYVILFITLSILGFFAVQSFLFAKGGLN